MTLDNTNTLAGCRALGVDLSGQHLALVGCGGIGFEVARICAALGARLSIFDRQLPPAARQGELASAGIHTWTALDLQGSEAQQSTLQACHDADALIITSAICPDESTLDIDSEAWDDSFSTVFSVNLAAPMRLSLGVLQVMKARGKGRIVLVGSMAGRNGGLLAGPQYAASKGALHTFVRWLALRAAPHGVSVNGVAPGVTATPMIEGRKFDASRIPAGRAAEPHEIARVISFMASPASSYMHGQVLDVNGGAWIG
ncbi:MAG: SDR family oxidoreductase [Comamonadaceae bacterium]|nr:MAG: SDR family oxidoreductase [Comamonadaceae bacterium]